MNEKLIGELLLRGIRRGDISLECSDEIVDCWLSDVTSELPDTLKGNIKTKLKLRLQDAALQKSAKSLETVVVPLGRLIEAIRKGAGLTRTDISERLGKPDEYVTQVEESDAPVPHIRSKEFADLMQLFHLTFSRISETVRLSIDSPGFGNVRRWSEAMTNGLQKDKSNEQLEGSLNTLGQKRRQRNALLEVSNSAESWLASLKDELQSHGRTDLLG